MPDYTIRIAWSHGTTLDQKIFRLLIGPLVLGNWEAVKKSTFYTYEGEKIYLFVDWPSDDAQVREDARNLAIGVAKAYSRFTAPAKAHMVAILKDEVEIPII